MPLLLHNWKEIVNLWIEATQLADDEGLKALLELGMSLQMHWKRSLLRSPRSSSTFLFHLCNPAQNYSKSHGKSYAQPCQNVYPIFNGQWQKCGVRFYGA